MPKRIPINQAKAFAIANDLKQVIIAAWDGERTHIVTYGDTVEACEQAAVGGNKIKKALGWPADLNAEPSRVTELKSRVQMLEGMHHAQSEHVKALLAENAELKLQVASGGLPTVEFPKSEGYPALGEVFCVSMTEFDFGQRHEGYLCFLTEKAALDFIRNETKDRRGPAPDAYMGYQYVGSNTCLPSFIKLLNTSKHGYFHIDELRELLHPK